MLDRPDTDAYQRQKNSSTFAHRNVHTNYYRTVVRSNFVPSWCVCLLGDDDRLISSSGLPRGYLISIVDARSNLGVPVIVPLLFVLFLAESLLNEFWVDDCRLQRLLCRGQDRSEMSALHR